MSFFLIPEIFNTIDMVLFVDKKLGMINAEVFKFRDIQNSVRGIAICINNAVWLDSLLYNGHERFRFVFDDLCKDLPATLQNAEYRRFSRSFPSSFSFSYAFKVALIQLNFTTKLLASVLLLKGKIFSRTLPRFPFRTPLK